MPDWNLSQMIAAPVQERHLESFEFTPIGAAVRSFRSPASQPWRMASIQEAMGVPAIQRCV